MCQTEWLPSFELFNCRKFCFIHASISSRQDVNEDNGRGCRGSGFCAEVELRVIGIGVERDTMPVYNVAQGNHV